MSFTVPTPVSSPLAFALATPVRVSHIHRSSCCLRRTARPRVAPAMTLQPQDCSWREEQDRIAIESEFLIPACVGGEVDDDMVMLRERIQLLDKKESQWSDIIHQFTSMSILTGIPFVDPETGEPTAKAWVLLSLSAAVPLYMTCLAAHWLQTTSIQFSQML